ncbi:MAG: hypothetical protein LBV72_12935 [Tannerella sp.]|jgi:hypothetical protein|nr:hypothetical protein [Tannerella sp.]
MNITKRLTITLLLTLCCIGYAYTQEYSVSLSGTFQLDTTSEKGPYDAFVFDGAGKAGIHAFGESKGDFLQIDDTIIIYPDKSIFVFLKKDEQTLVGINTWVKDQVFRKMENDTIITPMQTRGPDYAAQFYEFYTLTNRDAPSLSTYMSINMDSSLNTAMKRLCDEGFPKACLTMANALMLNSPALASLFRSPDEENQKMAPDKEIFDYYMKAIELNELDAIAQLGAYFLMLGHKEEAMKMLEKGCELGHRECCYSLLGLEISSEESSCF